MIQETPSSPIRLATILLLLHHCGRPVLGVPLLRSVGKHRAGVRLWLPERRHASGSWANDVPRHNARLLICFYRYSVALFFFFHMLEASQKGPRNPFEKRRRNQQLKYIRWSGRNEHACYVGNWRRDINGKKRAGNLIRRHSQNGAAAAAASATILIDFV